MLKSMRPFRVIRMPRPAPYADFLRLQEELTSDLAFNHLILAEHEPVVTQGRRSEPLPPNLDIERCGRVPVYRVSRGGLDTFHGPGQVCLYPIIPQVHKQIPADCGVLSKYSRMLGETLKRAAQALRPDLAFAVRDNGLFVSGASNEKVGFVGFGVHRWCAVHGCSLNYSPASVPAFSAIVPCGDASLTIGSLRLSDYAAAASALLDSFGRVFGTAALFIPNGP